MNNTLIEQLLEKETTPLYAFDISVLKKRVSFLRDSLLDGIELCYAVKANGFIIKDIEDVVDWLEICSPGEFHVCENLKANRSKYVISGVNKDESYVESVLADDSAVGYLTVESTQQFNLIRNEVIKHKKKVSVLLRLTSGNQFGMDKKDLLQLVDEYKTDEWINISGVQFFSGTQKTSLKKIKREVEKLDQLIVELQTEHNFKVNKLEYGPGFPISYFDGEDFDEIAYIREFNEIISSMNYSGTIALELGRSIAASCGMYLTKVVDTKENNSELYAIVDGGMHQIVYYGQAMAMKHPVIGLYPFRNDGELLNWNICGSLCTSNDFLVKRYPLSGVNVGDVLCFANTGAYCVTEGIAMFLTRDIPAVVLIGEDNSIRVVRKRIETEKINTPQII